MNDVIATQIDAGAMVSGALLPKQIVAQVQLVQQVLREVMKEDMHYGKIPGCGDKVVLLKPGAEKLCFTFQLVPTFVVAERDITGAGIPAGHREYRVTSRISNRAGVLIGEGLGIASTMEKKYRYRGEGAENTGKPVPQDYWDEKRHGSADKAQLMLGGKGFMPKKIDNAWFIFKSNGEKQENPDIADVYNTVLKIAKKRSLVDATITCTAASDIFDQDLDEQYNFDLPQAAAASAPKQEPAQSPKASTVAAASAATEPAKSSSNAASPANSTPTRTAQPSTTASATASTSATVDFKAKSMEAYKALSDFDHVLAAGIWMAFKTFEERHQRLVKVLLAVEDGISRFGHDPFFESLDFHMNNAQWPTKATAKKDAKGNYLPEGFPTAAVVDSFVHQLSLQLQGAK